MSKSLEEYFRDLGIDTSDKTEQYQAILKRAVAGRPKRKSTILIAREPWEVKKR